MDPIAASIADARSLDLANQVSVAVARKSMDAAKQQGAAALELLQSAAKAANEQLGTNRSASGGLDLLA